MSTLNNMTAQLQSRIKRRGNTIATNEMWKRGFHALGRMKDFRATKQELTELRIQQALDKKLLKMLHGMEREERYWAGVLGVSLEG